MQALYTYHIPIRTPKNTSFNSKYICISRAHCTFWWTRNCTLDLFPKNTLALTLSVWLKLLRSGILLISLSFMWAMKNHSHQKGFPLLKKLIFLGKMFHVCFAKVSKSLYYRQRKAQFWKKNLRKCVSYLYLCIWLILSNPLRRRERDSRNKTLNLASSLMKTWMPHLWKSAWLFRIQLVFLCGCCHCWNAPSMA